MLWNHGTPGDVVSAAINAGLPFQGEIGRRRLRGSIMVAGESGRRRHPGRAVKEPAGARAASGCVGVSILTGSRCELLRRTVDALMRHSPAVLTTSKVVMLINGADAETCEFAAGLDFLDECIRHDGPIMPIGQASSLLAHRLVADPTVKLVLHLQDDWEAQGLDDGWLDRASQILECDPQVGQVRLRHRDEPVLATHMLTGRPIRWEERPGYVRAESAHFTLNPSLIRAADVNRVFPCITERHAQAKFLQTGMAVAQLVPGVFRHLGHKQSLRGRLRR